MGRENTSLRNCPRVLENDKIIKYYHTEDFKFPYGPNPLK